MATSKRIGLQVLDDELLNLINASTKIFPITQDDVDGNLNPNNYEFGKLQSVIDNITYIYSWHTDDLEWVRVGSEDKSVDYTTEVKNKPTAFPPEAHSHSEYSLTTHNHDGTYQPVGSYANSTHNHDGTYAPMSHDHDGRYYTETEVNTLLGGKASTTHNHDSAYQPIGSYASTTHNHDSSYAVKSTETTVASHETRLSNIENGYTEGHSHANLTTLNKVTYTGTNPTIDLKEIENNAAAISNKADTTHNHDGTYSPVGHNHTGVYQPVGSYATSTDLTNGLSGKVDTTTFTGHTGNATAHVTQTDKDTWNAKQSAITGAATTIVSSNLTTSMALVSDSSGKVAAHASVTSTELGYLDGVTSSIQTQLGNKLDSSSYTASDVLTKIKTVDGSGSGLDADTLEGLHGSSYAKGGMTITVSTSTPSSPSTNDLWIDTSI